MALGFTARPVANFAPAASQRYVVETDALVCFNGRGDRRRAVLVDLEEAKKNLNIDDFPEPDPDVGTGTGYRRWEDD